MTPSDYVAYAEQQKDERPLYLFDAEFGAAIKPEVMPGILKDNAVRLLGLK